MVVDDFLRGSRKFNCINYLATQQIDLPPQLKASVFANCSRFFAFACSAADAALLAKEFGGPDSSIVAERLPDLKTGQAYVKVRSDSVRLLRVTPPDWKTTPELVAQGRARGLSLGVPRREIDAEITERRQRFMGNAALERETLESSDCEAAADIHDGYDHY